MKDGGIWSGAQRARWFLLAGWALCLAVLTLVPGRPGSAPIDGICLVCGGTGTADAVRNVVLFVPLGVLLGVGGWRVRGVLVLAVGLSASIELLQGWIPGRYPGVGDVLWNGLGSVLGAAMARSRNLWLRPGPVVRRRLALGSGLAALLVPALTAMAFVPAYPDLPWWGQWTHPLLEPYEGEVLDARLGPDPLPNGRIPTRVDARRRFLAGTPVRLHVDLGPPPPGVAQIFGFYDPAHREALLVGADGTDLVLRHWVAARWLRLDAREFRLPDAFTGFAPGEEIDLEVSLRGATFCASVAERGSCVLGPRVGDGWSLLFAARDMPLWVLSLGGFCWLAGLGMPFGFWAGSRRARGVFGVLFVSALFIYPLLTELMAPEPFQYAAPVLGVIVGGWASRCVMDATLEGRPVSERAGSDTS